MPTFNLQPMFSPKSIAIIGASGDERKLSARPLVNLRNQGYKGTVYPVNPKYEDIAGYKCLEDIESLPENIDLAIVSVSAKQALPVLEQLAERLVKSAVVYSSGFSEIGQEGSHLQHDLTDFINRTRIPVCGPNSLGFYNQSEKVIATFAAVDFDIGDPVAFITQSGAFGSFTYAMAKEMGLGYNYFVSTGNEAGVDFFDYVEYFAQNENVKVIGGYIEGARDLEKMTQGISAAEKNNKPIILMKVGSSQRGAEAASSHTSSLAGNQSVYESFFKQKNVVQVYDEEELVDTLALFNKGKISPNRGDVGIVTISGGAGIVMADKCEEYGIQTANLTEETTSKLKEILPPFASVNNPVDLTAQIIQMIDHFEESLNIVLEDENVEALVLYMQLGDAIAPQIIPKLKQINEQTDKTLVICWAQPSQKTKDALLDGGLCWLPTPTRAIKAVKNLIQYNEGRERRGQTKNDLPEQKVSEIAATTTDLKNAKTEYDIKQELAGYGISIPRGALVKNVDDAINCVEDIGYPVVLKVASSDITHKSDNGGVKVNINTKEEVIEAYKSIISNMEKNYPSANIEGILIEEMIKDGIEVFIGCFQDSLFGPCIMFGLGGIYVEVLSDVVIRKAPLSEQDAEDMIRSIKGYKILKGTRGKVPSDISALASDLVKISEFCWQYKDSIIELDINPLVVKSKGEGVVALDAAIVS
ncbi:acetate--CoA ligase family protein [Salicibibacter cibarius]|uniref:Acetate--CoA ligase family protein n=1 Tax=Salicibibacter cibarius TaxID=2743000 RepID=A0A7T7CC53_9BACI|nr:acetate--CoA ligase family protein [Salicibibacter cibarius]QQK76578.1 acetate--CoA ligase family protein [Salicibibacter cibarius]